MNKKIEVIPYLSFKGDCEEAVNSYIKAFGGEILWTSRWSKENLESPEQLGKIMHMEFMLGDTHMSGGDSYDTGDVNTDIKLMIHMDAEEEARRAIAVLADGGTILSPLQPHPVPDDGGCGSITKDRFGFIWIITCPNPVKQKRKQRIY